MSKPIFSIITVTFNSQATLRKTIDSVRSQTFRDFEYIIVDGGSSDKTMEIVRESQDVVSKWISEKDEGISDAFNKGIALAQGQYIGIINSDDWYSPDCLELIIKAIKIDGDAVYHGDIVFYEGGSAVLKMKPCLKKDFIWFEMPYHHPTCFVPLDYYRRYGGFEKSYRLVMDCELMMRFHRAELPFRYIPHVLAHMSFGGVSTRSLHRAYVEYYRASRRHSSPILVAIFSLCYRSLRVTIRELLSKMGLHGTVRMFRRLNPRKSIPVPLAESNSGQ